MQTEQENGNTPISLYNCFTKSKPISAYRYSWAATFQIAKEGFLMFYTQKRFLIRIASLCLMTLAAAWAVLPPCFPTIDSVEPNEVDSIFKETVPANTPTQLLLDSDHRKVVGWITGSKSFVGQNAMIEFGSAQRESVEITEDNTFEFEIENQYSQEVKVHVGDELSESIHFSPRQASPPFCYFVIERSAYRPGQTIKFAGFLRRENQRGEFIADANRQAHLTITSVSKQTKVLELNLESDEQGRIEGEYTFNSEDALGEYQLRVTDVLGDAKFELAEFRKSKVRLEIDGERDDRELKLKFQAVDFLGKAVPGSSIRYDAKIVFTGQQSNTQPLLPDEFVFSNQGSLARTLSFVDASEDEKLLHQFGSLQTPSESQTAFIAANLQGELAVNEDGSAEHSLRLQREWIQGGYSIDIDAVLTDYNGREQRAQRAIPLQGEINDRHLKLTLPKMHFQVGEPIQLEIQHQIEGVPTQVAGSVVAMRLSPNPRQPIGSRHYGSYQRIHHGRVYHGGGGRGRGGLNQQRSYQRNAYPIVTQFSQPIQMGVARRTLVDSQSIAKNSAGIVLKDPGAYQLVCMATLPDGTKLRNEIGCVVQTKEELPGLVVKLDHETFQSDAPLTGWIHSHVEDAVAMVTLRDSLGIRLRQQVKLNRGLARLDLQLPKKMRYGSTVEVEFLDNDRSYFSNNYVRILPVDQIVDLQITSRKQYGPGDEVTLDIQANQRQKMDLVVSVIDQSLLGIAPNKAPDVKSFFLADERVTWRENYQDVKTHLGGLTVLELIENAESIIKKDGVGNVVLQLLAESIAQYRNRNRLSGYQLIQLLNAFGINARIEESAFHTGYLHHRLSLPKDASKKESVYEVIQKIRNQRWQHFTCKLQGDTLVFGVSHSNFGSQRSSATNINNFGQGYSMGRARGDARHSVTGNAVFSHEVSGQALFSHSTMASRNADSLSDTTTISIRQDFSDTAFWKTKVRTDSSGKAQVKFKLPDSLTNWQVVVTAITPTLEVGQAKAKFRTFKPIMIWPMLPRSFTEGDVVSVYGSVHNQTDQAQTIDVTLEATHGTVLSNVKQSITVSPKSNAPVYWQFKAGQAGFSELLMTAECAKGEDASLKRLPVQPMVASQWITSSGFLENGGRLSVPDNVDLSEAELEITIVPSLISDVVESLEYLVQYPHGCVEQTMSRFLPAIAVKGVFDHANIKNEALEAKLPLVVDTGIKRLLELQQPDGGWGWHGGSATHEMMTPYALYGLFRAEMAGYEIRNETAIERGVNRLSNFILSMTRNDQIADRIYCMYVYSHRHPCQPEWFDYIGVILDGKTATGGEADPDNVLARTLVSELREASLSDYALALALEMAVNGEQQGLADRLAEELRQRAKGSEELAYWTTANFSRWGNDRFEITAAVLKAMVAYDKSDPMIVKMINFFTSTKRGNRWNSTKDTAMILYGICDYLKTQSFTNQDSRNIELIVGDWSKTFNLDSADSLQISIPAKQLLAGNNEFTFHGKAPGAMFRAVLTYHQRGEKIAALAKGVKVERQFFLLDSTGKSVKKLQSNDVVPKGSYIQSVVTATHQTADRMQYVLVENPKPSSCEILPAVDQRFIQSSTQHELREDKTTGVYYHHQGTGKEIIDRCVLHAEFSGTFLVPPAKAELMYSTLERGHSEGFKLRVE
ncbi:MG2 domain-containing protein [bacterium]|nr:MG2 domain-containing protein [bacterium]